MFISDNCFAQKNLKKLEVDFIKNGYPKALVNKLLFRTQNEMQRDERRNRIPNENNVKKWTSITNIPLITNKIISIFKSENIIISKRNQKTVGRLYTKLKDRTIPMLRSNISYKLVH